MNELLAENICRELEQENPLVMATIISRQGSTPRTAGTKMAVLNNGEIKGTIGGGLLESQVMQRAGELLTNDAPAFMSFDLTSVQVAAMDMICGGRLDIFLDLLKPDQTTIEVFKAWRDALAEGQAGFLLTTVVGPEDRPERAYHFFMNASGDMIGDIPFTPETLDSALKDAPGDPYLKVITKDNALLILEPTSKPKTAYIIGAGHVSVPTAHFAAAIGFRVVVLDDRAEFADPQRFPDASEVRLIEDYEQPLQGFPVDEDSFIVIVTRGHLYDKEALAQALKTKAGYIGMIGSKRKRNAIYKALQEEGFTQDDIDRVHSPIGLAIDAETPEEIAVSIVAEIIQIRAGQKRI
jgi:xanthine dehydrogenase accessory factor